MSEFHGPFAPEISPDGKLVAFEWFNETYDNGNSPSCSPQGSPPCHVLTSRQGVGITRSDGFTGFEAYGLMTGWINPSWTAGDMLLRSDANSVMNEDAVFTRVGPDKGDGELKRWFWDDGGLGVDDVELSPDHRTVVGIAGFGDELLRIYRPLFDPYNAPAQNLRPFATNTPVVERCAELSQPAGGKFQAPTLSPDGRGLAYADAQGVWTTAVPDLSAGCGPVDRGRLLLAGATSPDWGPADLPAVRSARPGLRVRVVPASLRSALRRGLVVAVRGGSGRVAVTALAGGRRVGRGAARTSARGSAAVRVRFDRGARRALARRRAVKLRLKVAVTPASGRPSRATAAVTLRR